MRSKTSFILALTLLSFVPAATLLAGCGGGAGGGVGSSGGGVFAGRSFSGVVTFGNQTGRLVVTVNNNNVATGTFTVTTLVRAVTNGAYTVTGDINTATGAFSLTITQDGATQTFTITGALPSGNNPGRFTLRDGVNTYTGVIEEGISAGASGLVITASGGSVNTAPLNHLIDSSGTLANTSFTGLSSDPAANPLRHLDVTLRNTTGNGGITAGTRFAVNSADPTFAGLVATAEYRQGSAKWNAVSGIIRVTTVGTASVTVQFQNVRFEADASSGASGGFTLNGSHTYANVTTP